MAELRLYGIRKEPGVKAERTIYLEDTPLEEARARFLALAGSPGNLPIERVPVGDSLGRVTAEPLYARISS
ncbi:MAG: hypothetical protein ACE5JJ_02390, partial [Nitrospinota bacterium]